RGRAAAGAPRSVKCSGRATVPAGPPSHTYTRPRDSSLYVRSKRMATRWPVSGWKGWVISSESEPPLYADAVWRNRRDAKLAHPAAAVGAGGGAAEPGVPHAAPPRLRFGFFPPA